MHIPHHLMLPQDHVDMLDKETGAVMRVHSTSFKESVERDPERYVLAGLTAKEPEAESDPEEYYGE